ncbi:MAG: polysaccharide deacetylase family protein [Gallionella sp.]|nr:polysaccharide deacetylase family protein [Gallionella sp.]MDD4959038.1 polysaccharide deacetylase family protein [Gallionella sp.]
MKPQSGRASWVTKVVLVVFSVIALWLLVQKQSGLNPSLSASSSARVSQESSLQVQFEQVLANYRKIIVLLAHEQALSAREQNEVNQIGQRLFHENLARIDTASDDLEKLIRSAQPQRFDTLALLLDYEESDAGMFDADRLAFRELLQAMQSAIAKEGSLPAIKLHKRIGEDMDALNEIEHLYEKEISQIFGRFEPRAILLKRERWDDYVAHLEKIYPRAQLLKENGVILPYPTPKSGTTEADTAQKAELDGFELPPKTVALTFDDGPHPVYSAEIEAILKQYEVPATFFNVGRNLGTIATDGKVAVSTRGNISRKLMQDGFVIGNHSFTHAQLSKMGGETLKAEINHTDLLLKAVDINRSTLFRFPYGASSQEANKILQDAHLKSVMWNIDSQDWADPLPNSIVERVLQGVRKDGRGIILFHDIHERTVKALPLILDRLVAEGYQFAGWDGSIFRANKSAASVPDKSPISNRYGNSWAIVIGIDQYAKWPKLEYAAHDAKALRQSLVERYAFANDHVFSLINGDATRNNILALFHDKLAHGGIQKDDRIFVFFAGHGATRKLSSGRDLGYIIPSDSDPAQFATDAIPMTEIQNIAENLSAKHVLFVMDACYSGLGLTRGGGTASYLRDNAKRIGRQMLTAGGADQMVADGGPDGHSIFTWMLLQGLAGKGDLNRDGLITATELAAYIAPAVASVSHQTPAFGSLPGSQGGEFVFELPNETEFLNEASTQLASDAIALNNKLATAQPVGASAEMSVAPRKPIFLKDLQGADHKVALPSPVPLSEKQMAQHANDRGLQLYKEKNYAAAEAEFTEALKLRPDFGLAANNLGFVFYKQGKFKEAALWFENTVKIDPSRAIAYLNLGDAYVQVKDKNRAKVAFQTYLALMPSGSRAAYVKLELEKL